MFFVKMAISFVYPKNIPKIRLLPYWRAKAKDERVHLNIVISFFATY
jgi:hypothetical protein